MNPGQSARLVRILLVEDNPPDVDLTREVLEEVQVPHQLSVAWDGIEALEFLRRQGKHADAPRPDIVLLDLNLPRKGGLQVLEEMKADPSLRSIPVVILTTSQSALDIANSYDLYANSYVVKRADLDQFISSIRSFWDFWLSTAKLPGGE